LYENFEKRARVKFAFGPNAGVSGRIGFAAGTNSMLLRGTRGAVALTKKTFDVRDFEGVKIFFRFRTFQVKKGDSFFVEYALNGTNKWVRWRTITFGDEFSTNNKWMKFDGSKSVSNVRSMRVRFRSRYGTLKKRLYIDRVRLQGILPALP